MGVTELHTRGNFFTWSNGIVGERRTYSKIDRVFINDRWDATWLAMICDLHQGATSDHTGLLIRLHSTEKPRQPFRFLNSTINLEGYSMRGINVVILPSRALMFRLNSKLHQVQSMTKQWLSGQSSMRDQNSAS